MSDDEMSGREEILFRQALLYYKRLHEARRGTAPSTDALVDLVRDETGIVPNEIQRKRMIRDVDGVKIIGGDNK